MCMRWSSHFSCLTQEVLQYSAEEFGPLEQIYILKLKARMDDILEKLQDIFSLPVFLCNFIELFYLLLYFGDNSDWPSLEDLHSDSCICRHT
ncbi:hypothetical protein TNIN_478981 [Trichonephila inaurata madagascariensis]|uniref:Uncharacterized protein n=1 Tax=Trichonephila inaurata madagascariensis TaxID=2747483 RepID=A0A8X7BZ41_9ARAC|nr:hypothetical protein TNIN_478981 [Trichonephila inaurata madagascariensis]